MMGKDILGMKQIKLGINTFNAPPNTGITEADQWRLTVSRTEIQL
jgi:hypothetical protein